MRITSTALASTIGYARTSSLNNIGIHSLRQAFKDKSHAPRYVKKMERIVAKRRYGSRLGSDETVPPNGVAIYLAAWYHKTGREEEAREIVKPHMREALLNLSDDDPSNDMLAYWTLSRALAVLDDELNTVTALHAYCGYHDGKAVPLSMEKNVKITCRAFDILSPG